MYNESTKYIFVILLLALLVNICHSQQEWKLIKDKNGIQVYTPVVAEKDISTFKAVTRVNSSVHSFVALLFDMDNFSDWGYNIIHADLLEREGNTMQIYYTIGKAPFPFNNRDGIYLNKFSWIADSSLLLVDIEILSDYLEKKDDLVRVEGDGFWRVKVVDSDNIDITFQMRVNPGGNIPSWLSNMFIETTPYNTLINLRKSIKNQRYQNTNFDFIN